MTADSVTLLVNPSAGRGKAGHQLPQIIRALSDAMPGRVVEQVTTTSFSQAAEQAEMAVQRAGYSGALVVVGGDGMASIGLNACAGTPIPLGIIPAGTGNDFCRGVGLPTSVKGAVDSICKKWTRRIDLMSVTGQLTGGASQRYVGSVVSTGFDERVNWRTNRLPFRVGIASYLFSVLTELRDFRPLSYQLTVDQSQWELDAMLVAVGNSGMFGGGMRICPNADVTDGLLDVTIVHPVSRATLMRLLPTVFWGGFVNHPAVELLRAKQVRIAGIGLYGMADGENLGDPPLDCGVVPGEVSLYAPRPA